MAETPVIIAPFLWTQERETAAVYLANAYTIKEAAQAADVHPRTVQEWLTRSEFSAEIDRLTLMVDLASRAGRVRMAVRMVRQRIDQTTGEIATKADVLDILKYIQSETQGIKLNLSHYLQAGQPTDQTPRGRLDQAAADAVNLALTDLERIVPNESRSGSDADNMVSRPADQTQREDQTREGNSEQSSASSEARSGSQDQDNDKKNQKDCDDGGGSGGDEGDPTPPHTTTPPSSTTLFNAAPEPISNNDPYEPIDPPNGGSEGSGSGEFFDPDSEDWLSRTDRNGQTDSG